MISRGRKIDETVNRMTGRKVVVRAAHDTPRQIDGDPIGAGPRADLRVPARQAAGPRPPLTQRGVSSKTLICRSVRSAYLA